MAVGTAIGRSKIRLRTGVRRWGTPIGVAVNLALSVVFALCLWAIRTGYRTSAEWALISSLSVLGNFAAWTGGGVASGAFSVNAVVLVFAAVLLRGPGLVLAFLGALVGAPVDGLSMERQAPQAR